MRKVTVSLALVAAIALTASFAVAADFAPGDTKVELVSSQQLPDGNYEYFYDVIATVDGSGNNHTWLKNVWLEGFDSAQMVNRWDDAGNQAVGDEVDGSGFVPKQNWTAASNGLGTAYNAFINPERWPSLAVPVPLWEGGPSVLTWVQPEDVAMAWNAISYSPGASIGVVNQNWYADNPHHAGSEYIQGESVWSSSAAGSHYNGALLEDPDGIPDSGDEVYEQLWDSDGISFLNTNGNMGFYGLPGLMMSFRVVHPGAPANITYGTYHNDGEAVTGTIIGPGFFAEDDGRLGDFTDDLGGLPDDMINAYDIDALADAILNGGDVSTFDLVIDGVLDSLDMDMLIEMLADTTIVDAGEEFGFVTGTFYGDFNLDGTVNLLDLNKLTANYNGLGGWTLGDANGDGSIALLDLNKLTANYNSTVVVPEPATMTLLALGAVALIRRKK
jgi:hypothetical protein